MLAVVLACFGAGVMARQARPAAAALLPHLDRFVLWVALPALILATLPTTPVGRTLVIPVAAAWGTLLVAVLLVQLVARRAEWDRSTTGTLLLVTALGNTSFLGLAAVEVLLGRDHLAGALAYDQLGTFLALATFGSFVASRYGVAEPGWAAVLRRLLTFPPFVALLVTVALRTWPLPDAATDALGGLGRLLAPIAMLALGLRFRLRVTDRVRRPAAWCLATKMVVLPALVLVAAVIAGATDELAWRASVLEAGMPPMVTAGVVATQAGLDEELSSLVVGGGLLLSALTLPLLRALLG